MVDEVTEVFALPESIAQAMVKHCLEDRPNEACGLLASAEAQIVHCYKMTNEAASPVRYRLVPEEYLAVDREMRGKGWDLAAVYHSHTRTEAYPSPTDLRAASEDVPYVIVSLANEPPVIRAFRLVKDNWMDESGEIIEIPVEVK